MKKCVCIWMCVSTHNSNNISVTLVTNLINWGLDPLFSFLVSKLNCCYHCVSGTDSDVAYTEYSLFSSHCFTALNVLSHRFWNINCGEKLDLCSHKIKWSKGLKRTQLGQSQGKICAIYWHMYICICIMLTGVQWFNSASCPWERRVAWSCSESFFIKFWQHRGYKKVTQE